MTLTDEEKRKLAECGCLTGKYGKMPVEVVQLPPPLKSVVVKDFGKEQK